MASGSNGNTKGQSRIPFKSTKAASRRKKLKARKSGQDNSSPF